MVINYRNSQKYDFCIFQKRAFGGSPLSVLSNEPPNAYFWFHWLTLTWKQKKHIVCIRIGYGNTTPPVQSKVRCVVSFYPQKIEISI